MVVGPEAESDEATAFFRARGYAAGDAGLVRAL
jgi:hypothetical protein